MTRVQRPVFALLVFLLLSVLLAPPLAAQDGAVVLPEPTGGYLVGTTTRHMVDEARDGRELMVQFWYPAESAENPTRYAFIQPEVAAAIAPLFGMAQEDFAALAGSPTAAVVEAPISSGQFTYPVLVFSHGMGSSRFFSTSLLTDLASHGYIVAAIDHTDYALATAFPDGRVVMPEGSAPLDEAMLAAALDIWVADQRFVLDQLESMYEDDPLFAFKIDRFRIGVFGHSFGGTSAVVTCSLDERCSAAINIDGQMSLPAFDNLMLTKPLMLINSDFAMEFVNMTDAQLQAAGMTRAELEAQVAESDAEMQARVEATEGDAYRLQVIGAAHNSFTDFPYLIPQSGGTTERERMSEITRVYVRAFFDRYVDSMGEVSALLEGVAADYPEVQWLTEPPVRG
jgi:pimeloyl-ACP methyl ester carboxylesterase